MYTQSIHFNSPVLSLMTTHLVSDTDIHIYLNI